MNYLAIKVLHYAYTVAFSGELLLRLLNEGVSIFCGADAFWNRLDAVLIFFGFVEVIMEVALDSHTGQMSILRAVRTSRVVRTVRLIRTVRHFHDFQKMAFALMTSFRTLLCSLALLIFVKFFFAVYLTQSAANEEKRQQIENLELRFG